MTQTRRHAAAGMTVSAFLRRAALAAVADPGVDVERLRRDVREARASIDDAWQALDAAASS